MRRTAASGAAGTAENSQAHEAPAGSAAGPAGGLRSLGAGRGRRREPGRAGGYIFVQAGASLTVDGGSCWRDP
jgi:hypothetical protein